MLTDPFRCGTHTNSHRQKLMCKVLSDGLAIYFDVHGLALLYKLFTELHRCIERAS